MWKLLGFVLLSCVLKSTSQLISATSKPQNFLAKNLSFDVKNSTDPKLDVLKNTSDVNPLIPKLNVQVNQSTSALPSKNSSTTPTSPQNTTNCSQPNPSSADPEKCCAFPDLFPDAIVDQCEKEFGMNVSGGNNEMLADSVSWVLLHNLDETQA